LETEVVAGAEEVEMVLVAAAVVVRIAADVGCNFHLRFVHSRVLHVLEDWLPILILGLLVEEAVLRPGNHSEVVGAAVLRLVLVHHLGNRLTDAVGLPLVQDHHLDTH
jgi:hypothetical protein